ncbi:MAG: undecaprenyldiphospho-muramoylpentapeptide beta-N-acetylglucosaminyltransferase [Desulfovibrionaceae bacterium]
MRRVILTTGGTGGHIFPALAVAEEIRSRFPAASILFVGGAHGPEGALARAAGLDFVGLPVRGVLGRGLKGVAAGLAMLRGVAMAMGVIGRFKPEAVVGFGGYAAFSAMLAGALRGVPTALHEQNSIPGVTNRIMGRFAKRIFLSLPDMSHSFAPAKTVATGNPVRTAIRAIRDARGAGGNAAGGRNLLVLGGSQGARSLNTAVLAMLPRLMQAGVSIRHQAGAADLERTRDGYKAAGADPKLVAPFIDDMAEAYGWADLCLCRAGATTVAELAVAGVPSVLVPFPYATHNHQVANARYLADAGAALCVEEKDFGATDLAGVVLGCLDDRDGALRAMAGKAASLGRPDAAAELVSQVERIAR